MKTKHEVVNICSNNPQKVKTILEKINGLYGKPRIKKQNRLLIEVLKTHGSNYKIKKIEVEPGQRLSYQYHNKRSETWIIIEGSAIVTINDNSKEYNEVETVVIPLKAKHRVENKNNSL